MLIIWKGIGWSVLLIFIVLYIGTDITVDEIYGEGYSDEHVWHIYLSTISSAILVAFLGYWFNHKKRQLIIDEKTGESHLSTRHSLFFISVEYWAIILPVFIAYMSYNSVQENEQTKTYLSSPQFADIYVVDFNRIMDDYKQKYPYGALKVISVEKEYIEVIPSEIVHNLSSGPKNDIRDGKTEQPNYFSQLPFPLVRAELHELHQKEIIIFVSRKNQ